MSVSAFDRLPAPERCPCGSARPPLPWRVGSKSYLFRLRCSRCGFTHGAAAAQPEKVREYWNEAVRARRRALDGATT